MVVVLIDFILSIFRPPFSSFPQTESIATPPRGSVSPLRLLSKFAWQLPVISPQSVSHGILREILFRAIQE